MKKCFFILGFAVVVLGSVYCQTKPDTGKFGIGADYRLDKEVNFPTLTVDYYLNKDYSLNLKYKPYLSWIDNDNSTLNKDNSNLKESETSSYSMELGIGAERHFLPNSKLDPFVGINATYLFQSRTNRVNNTTYTNASGEKYITVIDENLVGHNGFKGTANVGLNYFILKQLSVGAELNLGYFANLSEGKNYYKRRLVAYNANGTLNYDNLTESEIDVKSTSQGFVYTVSINASYFFGKKNKTTEKSNK